LEVYKDGATIVDDEGQLPIHYLFHREDEFPVEQLRIIIAANPTGTSARTDANKNVLQTALESCCYVTDEMIEVIHGSDPTAAQTKDSDGNLPLHLACKRETLEAIEAIYACYPAAISEYNNKGLTPLSCLFESRIAGTIWEPVSVEADTLRFLLRHCPIDTFHDYALRCRFAGGNDDDANYRWPDFVRRLLLRADPTTCPAELAKLNYAERRMAMFLIFSALSRDPPEVSFVGRLRSLAFDYGPDMYLVKNIVPFL
jgi:hypothetical protein